MKLRDLLSALVSAAIALVVTLAVGHRAAPPAPLPKANPPSWAVPAWYVDGANITGCASNANTCQSATCAGAGVGPCLTAGEIIVNRWATASPTLAQPTRITFLSDDAEPPFDLNPNITAVGQLIVTGTLTTVGSGTLGAVVQRNRATGQLLTAPLGQAVAGFVNLFFKDTTANVFSWIDSTSSGTTAVLSQPFAANTDCAVGPHESDTVATGHAYQILRPSQVPLRRFNPLLPTNSLGPLLNGCLENVWIPDPTGIPGSTAFDFNISTSLTQNRIDGNTFARSDRVSLEQNYSFNNNFSGGLQASNPDLNSPGIVGGIIDSSEAFSDGMSNNGTFILDGGVIVHGFTLVTGAFMGDVYVKEYLEVVNRPSQLGVNIGPGIVWGPGELQIGPGAVLTLRAGTTATNGLLQTGGLFFGNFTNVSTGCGYDTTGDPVIVHCGRTLTPAHIDGTIASGGFGGSAVDPWLASAITPER